MTQHVWFVLPDSNTVGRLVLALPRVGDTVMLNGADATEYTVTKVVHQLAEKTRHAKLRVFLGALDPQGRQICAGCHHPISDTARRTTVNTRGREVVVHDNPRCLNAAEANS